MPLRSWVILILTALVGAEGVIGVVALWGVAWQWLSQAGATLLLLIVYTRLTSLPFFRRLR